MPTPAETNITLIQTLYAAFGRGDVPTLLEHMADDIDWGVEAGASKEVPWHGVGKGKAFAAKFFENLAREATFTRFEPSGFLASDQSVACLVSWDATINKNGRKMSQNVIHHFTIKNGRVTKWRGSEDTALTAATWKG
jgi:ketosteroid isomerase-like protein